MESQRLLSSRNSTNSQDDNESFDDEDWTDKSDRSSSTSDQSDSDDSTIPDWEPYVNDDSGELFYIDCHPFVTHNKEHKSNDQPEAFSKTQLRKSTRGKFLRLLRRRESKRYSKKGQKPADEGNEINTQKVKFQDFQEGEQRVVTLEIDPDNRYNLSSDKSLAESLLGLIVSTLSDGNRVMVAGFCYDSKAKHERNIKIGDWLKSINNIDVNVNNLDDILQKFINHDQVLLTLQRVGATEVTKDPPINELNLESAFVRDLLNTHNEEYQPIFLKLCSYPIGVVYLNTEKLDERNEVNEDVIYFFPKPIQKNVLCNSRGMFITLSHLLQNITSTKPRTSSILYKARLAHIVYTLFGKKLFLFMLPDDIASLKEVVLMCAELLRLLEFLFGSLDRSFSTDSNVKQVDVLLFRYFARLLCNVEWITAKQFMEFQNNRDKICKQSSCQFEDVMPVVPTIKLHDDAMIQIDDALTELEASDYREWNEEPLDCQRLFTILGSALFHSGYLIASHLMHDDLIDVYIFCKQQGLLHLAKTEPVKSLVLWREVFPKSCQVSNLAGVKVPEGRRFLLVVGSGKEFLAVIMEVGGCTEDPEDNMGPDAFYVEEAQATLAHLQKLGISIVAERSLSINGGYQVITPTPPASKKKTDFMGALNFTKTNSPTTSKESTLNTKKSEIISILKRRSSEQNVANTSQESAYDAYSEESGSQCYSERLSETSDDSANRRARYDSNEEESDLEDLVDSNSGSFDFSEARQNLLSELDEYSPVQVTSGPHNVLYHFVQLDEREGILISPLECNLQSQTYTHIINNFRRYAQNIRGVFQNTLRFKNMPAQDVAKTLMNKSLIAIKEHGFLFQCPYIDDNFKKSKITYRVVGRLFYMPHPKEVYVCYHDSIPQNLVKLAFEIDLHSNS